MSLNYFLTYWAHAPIALARERSLELHVLSTLKYKGIVLDAACGDGFFSKLLFQNSPENLQLVGVDLNPKEVFKAKQIDIFSDVKVMDLTSLEYESDFFDTIFSNSSIEHIKDIDQVLSEFYRVLKQDGNLYLTLPTNNFEKYAAFASLCRFLKLNNLEVFICSKYNKFWKHYHALSQEDWNLLFTNAGFEVIQFTQYANKKFCLINDLLIPFGAIGKLNMFFLNTWKISENFLFFLFKKTQIREPFILNKNVGISNGGLIMYCLKKSICP